MHEMRKIVVDTSVLIAFEKLSLLPLLCSLYDQVLLSRCVSVEYSSAMQPCFTVADAPQGLAKLIEHESGLGCGESEAIALAYTLGTTVLLDDRRARKVAGMLGCKISGTIGVLCRMERIGLIQSAYGQMCRLKDCGFRVSESLLESLKRRVVLPPDGSAS
jgi:hypothetical protein